MNTVLRWDLELVGDWVDLLDNGEGANVSGTYLLTGQAQTDVPLGERDLLAGLILRGIDLPSVGLDSLPAHCPLKLVVSCDLNSLTLLEPVVDLWYVRRFPRPWVQ